MVSVIAPITAVSPQFFVFSLGILLVDYIKVADTFSLEVCFMYAGGIHVSAAESLELYHINFWSYIGSGAEVRG